MAALWLVLAPPMGRAATPVGPPAAGSAAHRGRCGCGGVPRIHSILVSWRGALVLERYYNGARATRLENIKSASKSIISALIGIAIERELIADVSQPIAPFFRLLTGDKAIRRKRAITIENLLTMQSGLKSTSNRNYGAWVQSPNWVRHALDGRYGRARHRDGVQHGQHAPAVGDPHQGHRHEHLAVCPGHAGPPARIVARAVAARSPGRLFRRQRHAADTPADDRVRRAYLSGGRDGRQVVPAAWVDASFVPRTRSSWSDQPTAMAGGCVRWPARPTIAWGFGGQYIFVVPDLDLVVVTTSSCTVDESRRSHLRPSLTNVEQLVIEPIARSADL